MDIEKAEHAKNLLAQYIRDFKKYKKTSQAVGQMEIGKSYEKKSSDLHFMAASLEKLKHSVERELLNAGFEPQQRSNEVYQPSAWHSHK